MVFICNECIMGSLAQNSVPLLLYNRSIFYVLEFLFSQKCLWCEFGRISITFALNYCNHNEMNQNNLNIYHISTFNYCKSILIEKHVNLSTNNLFYIFTIPWHSLAMKHKKTMADIFQWKTLVTWRKNDIDFFDFYGVFIALA